LLAAKGAIGPDLLRMLLPISATGHYFATFVRAYGDRELFARFRTRLTIAPVVLVATALGLIWNGQLAAVMLVTALWGFWHWLAQAFGFARIYDSKVGSYAPRTAFLDRALVVMGFVGTVVLNPNSTALFGTLFLDVGIGLPSAGTFGVVRSVTQVMVAATITAYLANLATTIARGQPLSWQKQCMHVTTIGYYWFAFSYAPNVLIAHVLYEVFHDVQYFAITWITCRARVQREGVAPWLRTMFRPGPMAAVLYIAAMAAFGGQVILSTLMTLCWLVGLRGDAMFAVYLVWQCTVLFQSGLTVGNLNASLAAFREQQQRGLRRPRRGLRCEGVRLRRGQLRAGVCGAAPRVG
jgi:hypothetical protein